jgi:multidrug efflux pump subunit AcrA (membrane-fusion protein)
MKPLLAVIPVLAMLGCGGHDRREQTPSTASPVEVSVAAVGTAERVEMVEAVGTVRARRTTAVSSRVLSQIRAIHVEPGQRVQAGQRLIDLDARELDTARDAARSAKSEVEHAIEAAQHGLEAAEAQLALAAETHKRFADLLKKDSVTRQEYDEASARLKGAQAAVETARAQRARAQSQRSRTEARIAAAEVMLGYAAIDAPVSGVVVERLADPGSMAAPGVALLRIEEASSYRLEASVPSAQLGSVRVGQPVQVTLEALEGGGALQGMLSEIVPEIDPASRTFLIKIALPPGIAAIRSGLFGRALLPGGKRGVLSVPAEAVMEHGQLRSVAVVQDGVARRRMVTLGELRGGAYEVLSGLADGETVVIRPGDLTDGAAVRVRGGGR